MAIAREVGSRTITCNAVGRIHRDRHDFRLSGRLQAKRYKDDSDRPASEPQTRSRRGGFPGLGDAAYITGTCSSKRRMFNGVKEVQPQSHGGFRGMRERNNRHWILPCFPCALCDFRLVITQVKSPPQIQQARELFLEYARSSFQFVLPGLRQELAGLPGDYALPEGRLLIAEYQSELAGCVALHKLDAKSCEMKRLYLRPKFRGKG